MFDQVGMWMAIGVGTIIAVLAWLSGYGAGYAKGRSTAEDDEDARKDGYRDRAYLLACMKNGNMVTPELAAHVRENLEKSKEFEARERAAGRVTPEREERLRKVNERAEEWLREAKKNPYIWR
jgi:hypothetical protein